MKKKISVLALATVFVTGSAMASGWRIPEQSVDSTAKSGANIASSSRADTAYYNPANMSWMENRWEVEGDLTYIHLTSVDYTDSRTSMFDGSSEKENFLLPTFFAVSPDYNNFRFGFSLSTPYGLAKRWKDPYPGAFSRHFSLLTFDANPTVSYKINDKFSIAGGVRLIYGEAIAKNVASVMGFGVRGDIEADALEWGYNLALSVRPTDKSNFSITYRSHVDMDADTENELFTTLGPTFVKTDGDATLPAPGVLSVSGAYTFDKLTVELTWDRTFWSEYETLDFDFDAPLFNPILAAYDTPRPKFWKDASAFRVGLEYKLNDTWTLLGGFAYDENPVPDATVGFETPDSDAWLYSIGARYKCSEKTEFTFGFLYDYKEKRTASNDSIVGEVENSSAILFSVGMNYKF